MNRILFCLICMLSLVSAARAADESNDEPAEPQPIAQDSTCPYCGGIHGVGANNGLRGRLFGPNTQTRYPELYHRAFITSRTGGEAEYTHNLNMYHAAQSPWHGWYYHSSYGRPVALVVPPTAAFQTEWAWGVGQTKTRPIYHQFQMGVPPTVDTENGGYQFQPTPYWPYSTEQFGVYPVRGPW